MNWLIDMRKKPVDKSAHRKTVKLNGVEVRHAFAVSTDALLRYKTSSKNGGAVHCDLSGEPCTCPPEEIEATSNGKFSSGEFRHVAFEMLRGDVTIHDKFEDEDDGA